MDHGMIIQLDKISKSYPEIIIGARSLVTLPSTLNLDKVYQSSALQDAGKAHS